MTQEEPDLTARLKSLDSDPERGRRSRRSPGVIAAAIAASVIPAGFVYYTLSRGSAEAPLATQTSSEFQRGGSAWGDLENPRAQPVALSQQVRDETPPAPAPVENEPQTDPATAELLDRLNAMQSEIAALREGSADQGPDAETAAAMEALRQQLDDATAAATDAQTQAAERERELERDLQERGRQIAQLESELSLARIGQPVTAVPAGDPVGFDPDRAEFERRRQEAEEAAERRRSSPMIAIGGDGMAGAGGADGQAQQEAARLDPNEEFVRNAGKPAPVQRAQVIVNPSNTVTQGTVIQAALETALDSTLPGPIRAVVTEDVHSYDGSRRLIPRGSKLIGKYSAGVEIGQNRVLVAWERIILPDNQSVTISAYGADEIGRSGTTGRVNSRFAQRFGSAALISLVSALPGLVADDVDNDNAREAAENVGDDLANATSSVMADYLRIPPTIQVKQGSRITVMVDRDLEIF